MLHWLAENLGTILISLLLAGIVIAVIASKLRAKRQGKSTCDCGCGGCAMNGVCHGGKGERR